MLASSFEGLMSSLWVCVCLSFLLALISVICFKKKWRVWGNGIALIGLVGAGFLLVDALLYHFFLKLYLCALGLAMFANTTAFLFGNLKRTQK